MTTKPKAAVGSGGQGTRTDTFGLRLSPAERKALWALARAQREPASCIVRRLIRAAVQAQRAAGRGRT